MITDKNAKPRDTRADHQSQSLHYFNIYAVQDQVDLSHLSNEPRITDPDKINLHKFMPLVDYEAISSNFSVLISRILMEHVPHLQPFQRVLSINIQRRCPKSQMW